MTGYVNNHDSRYDEILDNNRKITYFFKNNKCIGIAAVNCPTLIIKFKILLSRGQFPEYSEFLTGKASSESIISSLNLCKNCRSNDK